MKCQKSFGLSCLLIWPLVASAEVYRCEVDGKVTFSDRRCDSLITEQNVNTGTGGDAVTPRSGAKKSTQDAAESRGSDVNKTPPS